MRVPTNRLERVWSILLTPPAPFTVIRPPMPVMATFAVANRGNGDSAWRALLAPLGAAILLWICVSAIVRGRRVRWKGRAYVAR